MRLPITVNTLRELFARSGNKCSFPQCTQELVTEGGLFIAQICHIEAASVGGPRFNPTKGAEEVRAADNLILLCYPHHVEVDNDPQAYSVERLREIKRSHESRVKKIFYPGEALLQQLAEDMKNYWGRISLLNTVEHDIPDLAMRIDVAASGEELFVSLREAINSLRRLTSGLSKSDSEEILSADLEAVLKKWGYDPQPPSKIPYYENPFVNRNWEAHNLGLPNHYARIELLLLQVEIKYLEKCAEAGPLDRKAVEALDAKRKAMEKLASSVSHVD